MDVSTERFWARTPPTLLLLLAALFGVLGCGTQTPLPVAVDAPTTNCTSSMAQILVGDGFMRILCGCTAAGEAAGTTFGPGSTLNCHLPTSNTVVFFHYPGTVLRHQIMPSGANLFTPSPLSDPSSSPVIRVHAVTFSSSATTYSFIDNFSSLQGQIFVP